MMRGKAFPLAAATAAFFWAAPVGATTIDFEVLTGGRSIPLGQTLSVPVELSRLGDEIIGTVILDVSYDPSILQPWANPNQDGLFRDPVTLDQRLQPNGAWWDAGILMGTSWNIPEPGLITIFIAPLFGIFTPSEINLLERLQPTSFFLAMLQFEAVGVGTSTLEFSDSIVQDVFGDDIVVELGSASLTVGGGTQVAEPGTVGFLWLGVLVVYRYRRRPSG